MKTNSMRMPSFVLWLLLASLLVAPEAFAFYNPAAGVWLNRDPIGEGDGPNVHAFVRNTPSNLIDRNGRESWGMSGPGWSFQYQNGQWIHTPTQYNSTPQPASPEERSFFNTFFTYGPLSSALLNNYMDASGRPFNLSEAQMVEVGAKVDVKRGDGFNNYVAKLPKEHEVHVTSMPLFLEATAPGTLGRFYANINGTLKCSSTDGWQFDGTMTCSDVFDFNDDPRRGPVVNGMVTLARWGIPGKPFNVTSVATPISQTNQEDEAKWAGTGVRGSNSYYIH